MLDEQVQSQLSNVQIGTYFKSNLIVIVLDAICVIFIITLNITISTDKTKWMEMSKFDKMKVKSRKRT